MNSLLYAYNVPEQRQRPRVRLDPDIDPGLMPKEPHPDIAYGDVGPALTADAVASNLGLPGREQRDLAREVRHLAQSSTNLLDFRKGLMSYLRQRPERFPGAARRVVMARADKYFARQPAAKVRIRKSDLEAEGWTDAIPGGQADNMTPGDFDPEALEDGTEHELEHTESRKLATEIAMDHLEEDENYYVKLEQVEKARRGGDYSKKTKGEDGKVRYSYRKLKNDEVHDGQAEAAAKLRERLADLVETRGRKGIKPDTLVPLVEKYGPNEVTSALAEFGIVSVSGEMIYVHPYEVHSSVDSVKTSGPHEKHSAPHHVVHLGGDDVKPSGSPRVGESDEDVVKSPRLFVRTNELRKAPAIKPPGAPPPASAGGAPAPSAGLAPGAEVPTPAPGGATASGMAATAGAQQSAGPTGRTGTVAMPVGSKRIWNNRILEKKPDGKWHVVGHVAGLEGATSPSGRGEFSAEHGGIPLDIRSLTKDQVEFLIDQLKAAEERGAKEAKGEKAAGSGKGKSGEKGSSQHIHVHINDGKEGSGTKKDSVAKADSRGRIPEDRRQENAGDRHHRRKYMASDKGKAANRKAQQNYRSSHPERYRAQQRDYEPSDGHKCARCGKPAKHKHHSGYGKSSKTEWLCHAHHVKAHHPKSNLTKGMEPAVTFVVKPGQKPTGRRG